jgi:peptidoglycan/LPS O-acetylase OafA/YrhL
VYAVAQGIAGFDPDNAFNNTVGYTLFALGCAGVVRQLATGTGGMTSLLERRGIVAVGRISYGVYLYHMPVFVLLKVAFNSLAPDWHVGSYLVDFASFMLIGTALTLFVAAISFRVIERPLLRLKPGRGAEAPPVAAVSDPTV